MGKGENAGTSIFFLFHNIFSPSQNEFPIINMCYLVPSAALRGVRGHEVACQPCNHEVERWPRNHEVPSSSHVSRRLRQNFYLLTLLVQVLV